jgi:hypothetical protein
MQVTMVVFFGVFFMLVPFLLHKDSTHSAGSTILMFIVPLLGASLPYLFFQKAPRVVFDPEFITARYVTGTKTRNWSSVTDIFLSRKEGFLGQSLEATVVVFDNREKLILWQDLYRNLTQMRGFLAQKAAGKIRDAVPDIKEKNLAVITRRRYAGNAYTSFNTLLIVGMIVFFIIAMKHPKAESILFIPAGFVLLLFFGVGTQMNYFVIDNGFLIVRNHYFPWKNKRIDLRQIKEVDVETPNKRSTGLRVLSSDFSSRLYGAGTLRSNNWTELLNDLKLIGIPVRNDG